MNTHLKNMQKLKKMGFCAFVITDDEKMGDGNKRCYRGGSGRGEGQPRN